jgi:hypothetical protein
LIVSRGETRDLSIIPIYCFFSTVAARSSTTATVACGSLASKDSEPPARAPASVDEFAEETPAEVDVTYKLGRKEFQTIKELVVRYRLITVTY